jgi:hypothetical protein
MNYFIVVFKNKQKKRIIKKFITKKKALIAYNKMMEKSNNVFFEKKIQNATECRFELGLISTVRELDIPMYLKDEIGRNQRVYINNENNLFFVAINMYKVEETIFDIQQNKKITLNDFDKKYLSEIGLKIICILNHKIVVQNDDKFYLFSLKDEDEALRFLDSLSLYLTHTNNLSCMVLKSTSSTQKKYMYDLLVKYGFDPALLYRKFTAPPPRK